MTPTAELLDLPADYGAPKKPLGWAAVRRELEQATAYWLATVRKDGRPHVVPLDGLWVDDVWFYGGSDRAVHWRTALAQRLAGHANEKYADYGLRNDAPAYAEVLAWTAFPKDATRFTFS